MTNVHCYMFKTLLSSCADSASGVARLGRGRSAIPLNFGIALEPYLRFFMIGVTSTDIVPTCIFGKSD